MSSLLQHDQYGYAQGGNQVLFSSLSAGSTVLVMASRSNGTGTITGASDPVNGSYTSLGSFGDIYAFVSRNISAVASGSVTMVSSDGASSIWLSQGYEITGADTVAAIQTDSVTSEGSNTSHVCAGTGLTGTGFYAGISQFDSVVDWTPGSGWTTFNTLAATVGATQYKIETGASEQSPYTTASAITVSKALLVFIPDPTGGVQTLTPAAVVGRWGTPASLLHGAPVIQAPFTAITDLSGTSTRVGLHTAYHAAAAGSEAGAFTWIGAQDYAALTVAYKGTPAPTQTLTLPYVP